MNTRTLMVLRLTELDIDWFFDSGNVEEAKFALTDILMNGFTGFNNISDEMLAEELSYRGAESTAGGY